MSKIVDQMRACQKAMDEMPIPAKDRLAYGAMKMPRNWFQRLSDRVTGREWYASFDGDYFVVGFVDRRGLHTLVRDGKMP